MKMTSPVSWLRARSNSSRTGLAPTPTNFSTKSLPLVAKGDACLAGQGLGEQRLAGAWVAVEVLADGGFAPITRSARGGAGTRRLRRVLDGLVDTGDVAEALPGHVGDLRRCAERRVRSSDDATATAASCAVPRQREHDPDHGDEEERRQQQAEQRGARSAAFAGTVTRTSAPCAARCSSSRPSSSGRTIWRWASANISTASLAPASYTTLRTSPASRPSHQLGVGVVLSIASGADWLRSDAMRRELSSDLSTMKMTPPSAAPRRPSR